MASTLIITGSPSSSSRTLRFAHSLGERLGKLGLDSSLLDLRSLPADDLVAARADAPGIKTATDQLANARGVIVITPVYKAAYSGLLKTFLDLLPQFGLRDKVVLPLAMGGTIAHVLTIDYALRPVLNSLDPLHITPGLFLLDKQVVVHEDGRFEIDPDLASKLDASLGSFAAAIARAAHPWNGPAGK
ncbi:MAG: NADPH-dependent reductase [Pseudomonadota bacterium]|jgi:FMN reductase